MLKKSTIAQVATKSELKRVEKSLRQEILKAEEKVEDRFERIEDSQKRVEVKLDKIANTLDGFVEIVDNLRVENVVGADQTRGLEVKVDDHEKRIKQLESPLA